MKTNHIIKIALISAAILSVAACNKKPSGSPYGENAGGAQTYGYGSQGGFNVDSHGRRINPLTAPAAQTYYFNYDSNEVRGEDHEAMRIQANYLASHRNAVIRLEGNTDNRGSREYNMGLGWRRDQAVAAFFEQLGVNKSQIKMVSYGKERPVSLGDTEQAWSLNRRVDLIYVVK